MPIKAISDPSPLGTRIVFRHGKSRDVADAAFIEIAGRGVMHGVRSAPIVIRGECEDADDTACPIIEAPPGKEGAVATIMLDHEQSQQKSSRRNNQDQAPPDAVMDGNPCKNPQAGKRNGCHRQLERAAARVGRAVFRQESSTRLFPSLRECWKSCLRSLLVACLLVGLPCDNSVRHVEGVFLLRSCRQPDAFTREQHIPLISAFRAIGRSCSLRKR